MTDRFDWSFRTKYHNHGANNRKSYFLNRISNVHIYSKMLNYPTVKKVKKRTKEEIGEWRTIVKAVWFTRARFLER